MHRTLRRRFALFLALGIALIITGSLLGSLGLVAQGNLPGPERGDQLVVAAGRQFIILIDNSRSIAVELPGNIQGRAEKLIDFSQFFVRYLRAFEPTAKVAVVVLGSTVLTRTHIYSSTDSTWPDADIESMRWITCAPLQGRYDPCSNVSVATGLITDTKSILDEVCKDSLGEEQSSCNVLLFSDGVYQGASGALADSETQVTEALDTLESDYFVTVYPFIVGNNPSDFWERTHRENSEVVQESLDIAEFVRDSNYDPLGMYMAILGKLGYRSGDGESAPKIIQIRPGQDAEVEYSSLWTPETRGIELNLGRSSGVTLRPSPIPDYVSEYQYRWDAADSQQGVELRFAGFGIVAYQFRPIVRPVEVAVYITPSTVYIGDEFDLTAAITGISGPLTSVWLERVKATIQKPDQPQSFSLNFDPGSHQWKHTPPLDIITQSGVYSVVFELEPRDWQPQTSVFTKTLVVLDPLWSLEIKPIQDNFAIGEPITLTTILLRNQVTYTKRVDATINVMPLLDAYRSKSFSLTDSIELDYPFGSGTFTFATSLELPKGVLVAGPDVSFAVSLNEILTAMPTPQPPTAMPTPQPPTAMPTPQPPTAMPTPQPPTATLVTPPTREPTPQSPSLIKKIQQIFGKFNRGSLLICLACLSLLILFIAIVVVCRKSKDSILCFWRRSVKGPLPPENPPGSESTLGISQSGHGGEDRPVAGGPVPQKDALTISDPKKVDEWLKDLTYTDEDTKDLIDLYIGCVNKVNPRTFGELLQVASTEVVFKKLKEGNPKAVWVFMRILCEWERLRANGVLPDEIAYDPGMFRSVAAHINIAKAAFDCARDDGAPRPLSNYVSQLVSLLELENRNVTSGVWKDRDLDYFEALLKSVQNQEILSLFQELRNGDAIKIEKADWGNTESQHRALQPAVDLLELLSNKRAHEIVLDDGENGVPNSQGLRDILKGKSFDDNMDVRFVRLILLKVWLVGDEL